jgi:hypothetical protein
LSPENTENSCGIKKGREMNLSKILTILDTRYGDRGRGRDLKQ